MMRHRHIRQALYEFIRSELPPGEQAAVEEHLHTCATCRALHDDIRSAVDAMRAPGDRPSDRLPAAYWTALASKIEISVAETRTQRPGVRQGIERVLSLVLDHRRSVLAAGCAAAAVGAIVFFLQPSKAPVVPVADIPVSPAVIGTADERAGQVFRRSRVLLVGLENLHTASGERLDLSAERTASRELIAQTRMLRRSRISPRTAVMVSDLERILIEFANTNDRSGLLQVQLVRDGMRQENLLFRLRMAEAAQTDEVQE
jgi:hypothetical protein